RMHLIMRDPSAVVGAFSVIALYRVAEARRRPPYIGKIVGEGAEALDRIDPRGHVMFNGEYWVAESGEVIEPGEVVVIIGKERTRLKVRRK
ncbi:MAG: nodulation protein NfeD, partial [Methanothrix sp.]